MKKLLIPALLATSGIVGGAFIGVVMKPKPPTNEQPAAKGTSNEAPQDTTLADTALKTEGVHENVVYFDMSRQFVIPLMSPNGQRSLLVVQLQIEMEKGTENLAKMHEPKLRDAFLRTLLELSETGTFSEAVTSRATLDEVRYDLERTARLILGSGVYGVLIDQIMRQDV